MMERRHVSSSQLLVYFIPVENNLITHRGPLRRSSVDPDMFDGAQVRSANSKILDDFTIISDGPKIAVVQSVGSSSSQNGEHLNKQCFDKRYFWIITSTRSSKRCVSRTSSQRTSSRILTDSRTTFSSSIQTLTHLPINDLVGLMKIQGFRSRKWTKLLPKASGDLDKTTRTESWPRTVRTISVYADDQCLKLIQISLANLLKTLCSISKATFYIPESLSFPISALREPSPVALLQEPGTKTTSLQTSEKKWDSDKAGTET